MITPSLPRMAAIFVIPRQTLLNLERFNQSFLGDGERLHENSDISNRLGHRIHVETLIDNSFGEEAVQLLDPSFFVIARDAEVLPAGPAR